MTSNILLLDLNRKSDQQQLHGLDSNENRSSLPIMSIDLATLGEPMLTYCEKNTKVLKFLKMCANYWPIGVGVQSTFSHRWWFLLCRTLVCLSVLGLVFSVVAFALASGKIPGLILFYEIIVIIGGISVLPVQYANQMRLQQMANPLDVLVMEESAKICAYFGIAAIVNQIISGILLMLLVAKHNVGAFVNVAWWLLVIGLPVALYLTFNLFFLVVDLKVASILLDQLHILVDADALTFDTFSAVRSNIHGRVKATRLGTDIIIIPCLASIAFILYLVYVDKGPKEIVFILAFIPALIKERVCLCGRGILVRGGGERESRCAD